MKSAKLLLLMMIMYIGGVYAQTSCSDLNVYPMTKNKGTTGAYTLKTGYEEKAAQTYYYSGPGRISQVRIYGSVKNALTIPLDIVIYNVDTNGRPTTAIKSVGVYWTILYNSPGYMDVNVGNVVVNSNFAVAVEIPGGTQSYKSFDVLFNGTGEGRGEDLASIAGTSTGSNWTSASSTFYINGDFYILPRMNNFITAGFTMSSQCIGLNSAMNFTNTSLVSTDSMFNQLGNPKYSGSNFLYSWDFGDNSAISHTANPSHQYSKAGMYKITLTTTFEGWANTCTDVYQQFISAGLDVSATKLVNEKCYGDNIGSVTAVATGGVGMYKYSISGDNYSSNPLYSNLTAGKYSIYAMDSFGCIQSSDFNITQPEAIVPTATGSTNSSCGRANGGVSVLASGGTGSLKYSIDGTNFQASGNFSGLVAGHKTITIKDSIGCSAIVYIDVTDLSGPVINVTGYKNATCNGNKDGSITVSSSGGTGTPQYSIDGSTYQASGNFINLAAGIYGISVKDANGCLDIATVHISQPEVLSFTTSSTPAKCHGGNNGSIKVANAAGGSGNYTFSIDGNNYQSGNTFFGLKAAAYTVYLKDAHGCIATRIANVNEPDQFNSNYTVTNSKCFQSNDGSISISASGGTQPFTYSMNGVNYQPVNVFNNIGAGSYFISVKDANGCIYSVAHATVTQPTQIIASITTTNATCGNKNGKILAQASGGSGSGYKYSLDAGANYNTSGSFDLLIDSTYLLLIQDNKTCNADTFVTISSTNGPQFSSINHTDVSCHNGFDGTISSGSVTGGTGTLKYSIDGYYWQSSGTFGSLHAGTYHVLVKDAVGCTGSYEVTLKEPSAIAISISKINPVCSQSYTGTATIYAAGGNGTMGYSLDGIYYQASNIFTKLGAGMYTVFVRDAGQCVSSSNFTLSDPATIRILSTGVLDVTCNGSNNGSITIYSIGGTGKLMYSIYGNSYQSGNKFNNLSGGLYPVYVKDSNGCTNQEVVKVNEPEPLTAAVGIVDVYCSGGNNGAIILTVEGGTRPYRYHWNNLATTEDLFNIPMGTYTVVVTDANGCTYTNSYKVNQPYKPLIVNGAVENAHTGMNDGSIKLTISGGTGIYNYEWSNGENTQDISNLAPGQYMVIVKDINGCQVSATFEVSTKSGIEVYQGDNLKVNLFPNPANNKVTIDAGDLRIEQVKIMGMDGKIDYNKIINEVRPTINTDQLINGIYIVSYTINGFDYRQKITIQR